MAALRGPYPPGPCSLLSLPEDIIHLICDKLVAVGYYTTTGHLLRRNTAPLYCLARTCRILYELVVPKLYGKIICSHPDNFDGIKVDEINFRKIIQCIPSLQANQMAGDAVRVMVLGPTVPKLKRRIWLEDKRVIQRSNVRVHRMFGPSLESKDEPRSTLSTMALVFSAHFRRMAEVLLYSRGVPHSTAATMALVLSAPNLTKLYLSIDATWQSTDFLLNNKGRRPVSLPFLTTLDITNTREFGRRWPTVKVDLQNLDGLLHNTPNLAELNIALAHGGTQLTARLPQLRKLSLYCTGVCAEGFRRLVCGSPRLAEVLVHGRGEVPDHHGHLILSPRQALDALAPARLALRHLNLDTWMYEADGVVLGSRQAFPLIQNLRLVELFPALTQLMLDIRTVKGVANVLAGMEALEGLALMEVKRSERFAKELKEFMRRVLLLEWPRLRMVEIRATIESQRTVVWSGVRLMLKSMGFKTGVVMLGKQKIRGLGVVVAGVRFFMPYVAGWKDNEMW